MMKNTRFVLQLTLAAFLTTVFLALAGCGATGSAQGGGSDNGASGRVKIGVPF